MVSIVDPDGIRKRRGELIGRIKELQDQLEVARTALGIPKLEARDPLRQQIEDEIREVRRQLDELDVPAVSVSDTPQATVMAAGESHGSAAAHGVGANTAAPTPPTHPIAHVAGSYVRVAELLALKLDDGDHAFSVSTRSVLNVAQLAPVTWTVNGDRVIGPGSLLRAALWIAAGESETASSTLAGAIVTYLGRHSDGDRARLREGLMPETSPTPVTDIAPDASALDGTGDVNSTIANDELTIALADAARLTRELARGQLRVDVSYVVTALLRTLRGQELFRELGVIGGDPATFFAGLADTTRAFLERSTTTVLAPNVLDPVRESLARVLLQSEHRSPVRYVADVPVTEMEQDRLGMADDARALAEVMCLREPGPPLAIGLFGDWGSGKSSFMNLIEAAIEELTGREGGNEITRDTLVAKVVHVRFNAWHYNDANLWASLTSEFFSQLRAGGWQRRSGDSYDNLVREVLTRVETLDGQTATNAATAVDARRRAVTLQQQIDDLDARRQTATSKALADAAGAVVAEGDADLRRRVEASVRLLGRDVEVAKDKSGDPKERRAALVEAVTQEVGHAAALPGRIALFVRAVVGALFGQGDRAALALLWLAAIGGVAVLLVHRPTGWDEVRRLAAAAAATIVPLLSGLRRVYRVVEPLFRAGDDFVRRRRTAEEDIERDLVSRRTELAEVERQARAADLDRAQGEAEAARFRGATPDRVFDYYLNVSTDTRQFEQQLGTVSQVRRAFDQLNAIFHERDRLRVIAPQENTAGEARLQQLDAQTKGVERIVLYIDDLDRCQVQQVVRVLEAVHLLLAFPLFVVVVGVDARWLEQSLLKFYANQVRESAAREGTVTAEDRYRPTVQDYLEKIFQIPIRLQAQDDTASTSIEQYLRSVAGPVEAEHSQTAVEMSSAPTNSTDSHALHPVIVELRQPLETASATVMRLTLQRDELTLMTSLSPLLGKSPRVVKRFINLYRLVRGRRRGAALEAFVRGVDNRPPLFPAYQFWLAVDAGLRPEQIDLYRQLLLTARSVNGSLSDIADALCAAAATSSDPNAVTDARFSAAAPLSSSLGAPTTMRHAQALRALMPALPRGAEAFTVLAAAEQETQRFSLHRR